MKTLQILAFMVGLAGPVSATLTLPPCLLNYQTNLANSCQTISGFGTTSVFAGVAATAGAGFTSTSIDVLATTEGPVRPGYLDIMLNSSILEYDAGAAGLRMSVGNYGCTLGGGANFCFIDGSDSDTGFLPFTLGEPFAVELSASASVPPQFAQAITAGVAGAISFSVNEQGQYGFPGDSVPILQFSAPEPPGLFMLFSAALALAWPRVRNRRRVL